MKALAECELHARHFELAYQIFDRVRKIEENKNSIDAVIGQLKSASGYNFEIAKEIMKELSNKKEELFTDPALNLIGKIIWFYFCLSIWKRK